MFIGFKKDDGRLHIELGREEMPNWRIVLRFYISEILTILAMIGMAGYIGLVTIINYGK